MGNPARPIYFMEEPVHNHHQHHHRQQTRAGLDIKHVGAMVGVDIRKYRDYYEIGYDRGEKRKT